MKSLIAAMALILSVAFAGTAVAKGKGMHGLHGRIVSADSTTVVVKSHGKDSKQSLTVTTDANTVVTIDGKPAKVGDLTAGLFVNITPSEGTATMITASTTKPEHHKGKKAAKGSAPTTQP